MNRDTKDFLETLLWLADSPDANERLTLTKTVYDFSEKFVESVDRFIAAFRRHLTDSGIRPEVIEGAERSFGGNVYLSLSGHGAGFFDDRNEDVAELQDVIKKWAGGNRFEELGGNLDVGEDGKIDLCYLPQYIDAQRDKLFAVP